MKNMTAVLAALCISYVPGERAAAQDGPRVLAFDQAHGQQPPPKPLEAIANRLGLQVRPSPTPIGPGVLGDARILFLRAPSGTFTEDEAAAIVAFVKRGGRLLLVLDEERRQSLEKTGVNRFITPFGLKLTPDTPYIHNIGGIAKAGEINKADRELPFSGGRAVEGGTPFAYQLDRDGRPRQPFGAYVRLDAGGRVVVLGEGMASLFLGSPNAVRLSPPQDDVSHYWGKDSLVFMEEVLAWLAS